MAHESVALIKRVDGLLRSTNQERRMIHAAFLSHDHRVFALFEHAVEPFSHSSVSPSKFNGCVV